MSKGLWENYLVHNKRDGDTDMEIHDSVKTLKIIYMGRETDRVDNEDKVT